MGVDKLTGKGGGVKMIFQELMYKLSTPGYEKNTRREGKSTCFYFLAGKGNKFQAFYGQKEPIFGPNKVNPCVLA